MKKAIVAVINDLVTDQRVHRTCQALVKNGYKVRLVGRKLPGSSPVNIRPYQTSRMPLLFRTGPLFYFFFNLRLFFFMLFRPANLIVANDLDTLPACSMIAWLKSVPLWYDTHEIFCEVPELIHSGWKKKVWERIERRIFPKLKFISTVNDSIAGYYGNKYGKKITVIRNIPAYALPNETRSRATLGFPEHKNVLILQGSGINVQRGAEELVEAMQYVDNVHLCIIGGGDVLPFLKKRSMELGLTDRIMFRPKMSFTELMHYTMNADGGITLDKDTNLNYRYSLPNKIFDYIHCGIPVIASRLPEINKIYEAFPIGLQIASHEPKIIAETIRDFFSDKGRYRYWKEQVKLAATANSWEKEEVKLNQLIASLD